MFEASGMQHGPKRQDSFSWGFSVVWEKTLNQAAVIYCEKCCGWENTRPSWCRVWDKDLSQAWLKCQEAHCKGSGIYYEGLRIRVRLREEVGERVRQTQPETLLRNRVFVWPRVWMSSRCSVELNHQNHGWTISMVWHHGTQTLGCWDEYLRETTRGETYFSPFTQGLLNHGKVSWYQETVAETADLMVAKEQRKWHRREPQIWVSSEDML